MARDTHERHTRLLGLLQEAGQTPVAALVRELGVSEPTLRRDLVALEKAGKLTRTFGGARLLQNTSLVARSFGEKREEMRLEKERIGRAAAHLVQPGMIVALDSGTTVWRVAAALRDKAPLTILTSALAALEELGSIPDISVHLVGGKFRLENLDFVGATAVSGFERLHADIAFVGVDSFVPGRGAFALDEPSASVAAAIARCADRTAVVLDHSKFGAKGYCLTVPGTEIDWLITDEEINTDTRRALEADSFELILAR